MNLLTFDNIIYTLIVAGIIVCWILLDNNIKNKGQKKVLDQIEKEVEEATLMPQFILINTKLFDIQKKCKSKKDSERLLRISGKLNEKIRNALKKK